MENNNRESGFSYTYSAKEQAELKRIREKYTPPTESEDKMTRLYRLDASVTKTAMSVAITLGVIGLLIMGCGMSLVMTDFADVLGAYRDFSMLIGIIIGIVGGILAGIAFPVYHAIVKHKRAKIAPEILRLTDELMK